MNRRNCAGFPDAWMTNTSTRWDGSVREAPRHEIAGSWRRRRNSLYGDLTAVRLMAFGGRGRRDC